MGCLIRFLFSLFALVSVVTSCGILGNHNAPPLVALETIPEAEYVELRDFGARAIKLAVEKQVEKGNLDAETREHLAYLLDAIADGSLLMGGPGSPIVAALEREGFAVDEILLAIQGVQIALRQAGVALPPIVPPESRAADLLSMLARAVRGEPLTPPVVAQ